MIRFAKTNSKKCEFKFIKNDMDLKARVNSANSQKNKPANMNFQAQKAFVEKH